jgi:PAS domain S-box-containing protein
MPEPNLAATFRQLCESVRRLTQTSITVLGIARDKGEEAGVVAIGLEEADLNQLRQSIESDHNHPARVVSRVREIIRRGNRADDPTVIGLPASHPPLHSYVFVPVASPSRIYGWLAAIGKNRARAFSDEDVEVVTTFGALAGTLYENARLQAQVGELREDEERTGLALSATGIAALHRDVHSPWLDVSRSAAEVLGLPRDVRRVALEDLYERMHVEDAPVIRSAVERAIEDRSDFSLEFRRNTGEGSERWFQFRGRVLSNEQGTPARIVAVVTDITEQRRRGIQSRQSQKMEALAELAGGVSHDFNNLLMAIMSYGQRALESASNPSQRRDIEEIVKAATRAAAVSRRLLAFSRRQMVESDALDLNLVIADLDSTLRQVAGQDIELTTSLAAIDAYVRADRSQLQDVVMDLVSNARDACSPRGHVRLVTDTVEADESIARKVPGLRPGAYVTLSIVDTGSGMDEATKSHIFEPFFTTKPRDRGTGLGLATVYGIVNRVGGAIEVESEIGRGSTFTVYLPREKAAPPLAEQSVGPVPATREQTVLLVEDEQALREVVRMMLERAGYRVVEAATPEEAINRFSAMESVDLLLADVIMPGMSGFDLFQKLVERRPSLRVLFMSGYTGYARLDPIIALKGAALLEKPFSSETLARKVREVLGR